MVLWIDKLLASVVRAGPARGIRFVRTRNGADFSAGDYETPVQDVFQNTLRRGHVFLDIGANLGFFSLLAARLVGIEGRVYSFEPIPANLSIMRRNIALNRMSNITIVPKAISSSCGVEGIWLTQHSGGATMDTVGVVPADARGKLEVERTSVDEWMDSVGQPAVRMVKVDVEGAGMAVLNGMSRMLARFKPIVLVELDDPGVEGMTRKLSDFCEWCRSIGYKQERLANSYSNRHYQVAHVLAQSA